VKEDEISVELKRKRWWPFGVQRDSKKWVNGGVNAEPRRERQISWGVRGSLTNLSVKNPRKHAEIHHLGAEQGFKNER